MAFYIVKHKTGNFENQPDGFKVLTAIENRFWRCECEVTPRSDFVVEFPREQEEQYWYYKWPSGKKLLSDPFGGRVNVSATMDEKRRWTYTYNNTQLDMRLALIKWFAINVWIPDKQRLENLSDKMVRKYANDINLINNDMEAKAYVVNNLYYDL